MPGLLHISDLSTVLNMHGIGTMLHKKELDMCMRSKSAFLSIRYHDLRPYGVIQ